MAVIELTKDNFEQVVTDNDFVIVDFWAPWCGPCRGFAPVFEKVSEDHENIVFAKVDTVDQEELAAYFQIRSIPTLMVFREKVIVFSQPGALPESSFVEMIGEVAKLDMAKVHSEVAGQQAANEA
jgi:thioredoxin 1